MTLIIDLPEDRLHALETRAQAQRVFPERYAQQVLEHDLEAVEAEKSLAGQIREIWADLPADVRAKLPRDGARLIITCTGCPRETSDGRLSRAVPMSYRPRQF